MMWPMKPQRKRMHSKVVRLNLTVPPVLFNHLQQLVSQRGYAGPSDYLQSAIRRDAKIEVPA